VWAREEDILTTKSGSVSQSSSAMFLFLDLFDVLVCSCVGSME